MSILPMRKVEIIALRRDVDLLLERIGAAGCFKPGTADSRTISSFAIA